MNARELARKLLEWGDEKANLDALTEEIRDAVLDLGKTQNVGNVRASYSGGRKAYNYPAGAEGVAAEIVRANTALIPATTKTDWKAVCEEAKVENVPFTQSAPSVTVKLMTK